MPDVKAKDEAGTMPDLNKVLVVDDNDDALITVATALRLEGFEVRTAPDGLEALHVAKEFKPAIAFIDIGLPTMDGYTLAEEIRRTPALRHTRLVAITGYTQEADRERARESGFEEHLAKPADMRRVIALASSAVPHPPPDPARDVIH